jgi:hypothetical protein
MCVVGHCFTSFRAFDRDFDWFAVTVLLSARIISAPTAFLQLSQGGRAALVFACSSNRSDCARLLLDAGANKNSRDSVRISCRHW